ncbi:MAG: hypothetical protein K2H30_06315 [Clostridia bacterium]|nr:hypothetical protein [Clostridia bacterium]
MKTFITIKMTEQEFTEYKEQQTAIVKAARLAAEKKEIQEDFVEFAQTVYEELNKVLDGNKAHLGLRTTTLLVNTAEELLERYG